LQQQEGLALALIYVERPGQMKKCPITTWLASFQSLEKRWVYIDFYGNRAMIKIKLGLAIGKIEYTLIVNMLSIEISAEIVMLRMRFSV